MIKVLDKGFVELVDHMGDDETVVRAARVSFAKDEKAFSTERDEALMRYMLENQHTSPFEHIVFTFHLKCPLFVRSQIHRHRTFSYNEISRRYTSEELDFYIPTALRKQAENNRQASTDDLVHTIHFSDPESGESDLCVDEVVGYSTQMALLLYHQLLKSGVAREQARMLLPQNMYTRFYMTGNLHNWFHFLDLRNSDHAQYETRLYAQAIEQLIGETIPTIYKIWRLTK